MLGPADYGVLAVLMSLVYIYGIPAETIQNIITKYTSILNLKKEEGKIRFLMIKSLKKGFNIALILFAIAIIPSIFLSRFLNINFWLIILMNLLIFSSLSLPAIRGILQGRKEFASLGNSVMIEAGFKLVFAISLVLFGLKVFGAVVGVLLGFLASMIFTLYFNKDILEKKEEKTSFKDIYSISTNYLIVMMVVLLVFSLDIILAKRFFSAEIAGKYSVLSMLGKMIFLSTLSIGKVMFPLTSEKHECKIDSFNLFKKSFIIISTLCLIAIILYTFFPELIIGLLYGKQYVDVAGYLIYAGIALSFLSLSNLILLYGLSVDRIKNPYYLFIFLIIDVLLLFLFHSSMLEYIMAFMVSNIIMFIGSFFFIKHK